jgi:AraC family ethanolamine operon transcriptional activator
MADDQAVRTHRFENAEEAAAAVPGAQVRYMPLGRPIAPWHMVEVRLGQSRLLCGRMGADTSIFGTLDPNLLYFLMPLSGSGWKTYGNEIGDRSLVVLAETTDYAVWLGHSMHSMSLQVPVERFARAYSTFAGGALPSWRSMRMFTLDVSAAKRIRDAIAATLRMTQQRPQALDETRVGEMLEDLILERLLQAVCTTSSTERPGYRALTSRCNDYLAAHADRCVTLSELRGMLEVGDRSLRRFFMSAYGASPARFLRMQRLHGANRALGGASPAGTITDTAMSFGFFDLGRFAGDYRRLFGERPSETLRRSRDPRPSK